MKHIKLPKYLLDFANVFYNAGYRCYFVGGSIRDKLLGLDVNDWDVATDAKPEDMIALFKTTIPTGIKHGTITIRWRGMSIETTTFRTDGEYADGRRPSTVQFTDDLLLDLSRRDFTINGMALDPRTNQVVDPHNGQADLKAGIIRAIGNPYDRFNEDGLRPLRAVRFAAKLGFTIEQETLEAIPKAISKFRLVSVERVHDEFNKILLSANAGKALHVLYHTGLLQEFLPELHACYGVAQGEYHSYDVFSHIAYVVDSIPRDLVLRLAALFHDIAKPQCRVLHEDGTLSFHGHEKSSSEIAATALQRLKYPNAIINAVVHLVKEHMFYYTDDWTDAAVRRFIARVGIEYIKPLLQLRLADATGKGFGASNPITLMPLLQRIELVQKNNEATTLKDVDITGNDLIKAGWEPGPEIGNTLNYLLECVIDDPELNTKEKLLTIAINKKAHTQN